MRALKFCLVLLPISLFETQAVGADLESVVKQAQQAVDRQEYSTAIETLETALPGASGEKDTYAR